MNTNLDTIAAIATPPGTGAISVVRMSGASAKKIAEKIFSRTKDFSSGLGLPQLMSQHAHHGYIYDPSSSEILDEVILVFYEGPKTYTGEDLVEISCHGGRVVTGEILSLLLSQGARPAARGEFTQRAFLSGRLDLTQAEAVLDLIAAKTSRGSRMAVSALSGQLGRRINSVRGELMDLMTRIVAGLDFPEEIGDAPEPEIEVVVRRSLDVLSGLISHARGGKFLRDGLKLAIVGRPNAGKSSLLNALLKHDRAIVTDIPGTTRDAIEEPLDLNGIPVIVVDTAGLRDTEDPVEQIGIERSKRAIEEADLICLVVDLEAGFAAPEVKILEILAGRPLIVVGNKLDLKGARLQSNSMTSGAIAHLSISARTGENLDALLREIEVWATGDNSHSHEASLNARQEDLARRAHRYCQHVLEALAAGLPQDCLSCDLKMACDSLSEVSGHQVSEEVITSVFAQFCIGK